MKKIQQIVALSGVFIALSLCSVAQTSASKTAKIKKVMELTGTANLSEQMLNQFSTLMGKSPSDKTKVFFETFRQELDVDALMAQMIPIYAKHYTDKDLDGLIKFYESDLGKKMTLTLPAIMQESMQLGQVWGKEAAERAMKKIKEKEATTEKP